MSASPRLAATIGSYSGRQPVSHSVKGGHFSRRAYGYLDGSSSSIGSRPKKSAAKAESPLVADGLVVPHRRLFPSPKFHFLLVQRPSA